MKDLRADESILTPLSTVPQISRRSSSDRNERIRSIDEQQSSRRPIN